MDEWTQKIHALVDASKEIPMWGTVPAFPWQNFNELLSKGLELHDLSVSAGASEWRTQETTLSGLGDHTHTLTVQLSPLAPPLYIVVPAEDITRISSWLVPEGGFTDPDLQRGFYHYLCLHALHAIDSLKTIKNLSPKIVEEPFQNQDAYCIDLAMTCKGMTAWGRLMLSKPFQEALKQHYASEPLDLRRTPLSHELPLMISLEAGKTLLTQEEFLSLSEGDFLLLDRVSYRLSLANTPLFRIEASHNHVKILEPATFEEDLTMVEPSTPNLNPADVPILLTVEIARLELPLSELLALKAGNTLELGEGKAPFVSITAHGKCVAKGELMKIGEVTGVKLTEVGHG